MRAIIDGVWQVGGDGLSHGSDAAIYLVEGSAEAVLIDAGTGRAPVAVRRNIEGAGVALERVKRLVLTHCHVDHAAGVPSLRAFLDVEVVAHARCAEILEPGDDPRTAADWYGMTMPAVRVDVPFEGLHTLDLGDRNLDLHPWPGHSPGSIVATLDVDGTRVLFGQDVHGPIHRQLQSDWSAWQASLRRLLELEADILCEGHYGVIHGKGAVAAFIERFLEGWSHAPAKASTRSQSPSFTSWPPGRS
jgi:glyoxylase-like metal-dependent hydrolase (beta-lactamase superfamily II)